MSNVTSETENTAPVEAKKPARRKSAKKAKGAKKSKATKRAPSPERTNKKAEVVAMMKRASGATLEAIMHETGWQKHTVRGFVSILGSKGGLKIDSSKNAAGDRVYRIAK